MSDERPKPKYGELAPEGWVWQPPKDAVPEVGTPAAPAAQTPPAAPVVPSTRPVDAGVPGSANVAPGAVPARRGDRIATLILLAAGLLATVNMVTSFLTLPSVMQQFMDLQGIAGVYSGDATASSAGAVGAAVLLAVYALTALVSVQRLRAGKLTFFVPIIGAVLGLLINIVVVVVALLADPSILAAMQP
ncbi:DUF6264 family protein [Herbiconiux sp. YIM B11900]|uniref:DUF6264 family protein n=1 Tax=Herbiconiux sp. YIM B11900 TaxID=3404131 RepID=UPI003F85179F